MKSMMICLSFLVRCFETIDGLQDWYMYRHVGRKAQ